MSERKLIANTIRKLVNTQIIKVFALKSFIIFFINNSRQMLFPFSPLPPSFIKRNHIMKVKKIDIYLFVGSIYVATVVPDHSFCPYLTKSLDACLFNLTAEINYWIIDAASSIRCSPLSINLIAFQ